MSSFCAQIGPQVFATIRQCVLEQNCALAAWLVVLAADKNAVQGYVCFMFSPQQVARAFCFGNAAQEVARKLVPDQKLVQKNLTFTTFEDAKKSIEAPVSPRTAQLQPRKTNTPPPPKLKLVDIAASAKELKVKRCQAPRSDVGEPKRRRLLVLERT